MKALIIFHDNTDNAIEGKDLHIHLDAPGAYHLTDAFYNHKLIGAFSSVREIRLEGKPKQRKAKQETLTIEVDTTKLQACIKETMLELEELADKEQFIHKDQLEDYIDKRVSNGDLVLHGLTNVRMERGQLKAELAELRDQIQQLAFVPPDVATAAKLLDAELLVFLDHSGENAAIHGDDVYNIGFGNGLRFAIGKLTGKMPSFQLVPFNPPAPPAKPAAPTMPGPAVPLAAPTLAGDEQANDARPATCTCPPKRNIIDHGHLSYCPAYEGKADCEAQPVKW